MPRLIHNIRSGSRISGKGIICIKEWGFALLILSHFPENEIIWSHLIGTKLFHFHHGYLKMGWGGGFRANLLNSSGFATEYPEEENTFSLTTLNLAM